MTGKKLLIFFMIFILLLNCIGCTNIRNSSIKEKNSRSHQNIMNNFDTLLVSTIIHPQQILSDIVSDDINESIKYENVSKKDNNSKEQTLEIKDTSFEDNNSFQSISDYSKYGYFTIDSMTKEDYWLYENQKWTPVFSKGKPEDIEIDFTKKYTYKDLENIMLNMARYENVSLFVIGKSEQGRNIYSISIDFNSENKEKNTILITGQVHAREFAGSLYILKQYNELIKLAQNNPQIKDKLTNIAFHSVPVVNPDGREMIVNGYNHALKANSNGVDLNRNFNSVNAGQRSIDLSLDSNIKNEPGLDSFPGYTIASESETRAIMKWINTHITNSKGNTLLLDYHQQGHVIYSTKPWRPLSEEINTEKLQNSILSFLNNNAKLDHYAFVPESNNYGLFGVGGTITDYAVSVADGFIIEKNTKRLMLNVNNEPIPLIQFKDLDHYRDYYVPTNSSFVALTLEIGKGNSSLGYDQTARNIMQQEYSDYNYDKLLLYLTDLIEK